MARGTDRLLVFMLVGVGLIILAGLMALIMVGGREGAEFPSDSPEWVVQRYLEALEEGDWAEAYGYLSDSIKDEDLQKSYARGIPYPREQSRRILLEKSEIEDGEARVIISIATFRSSGPLDTSEYTRRVDLRLRREEEQWKIVSPDYPPFLRIVPLKPARSPSAENPLRRAILSAFGQRS